MFSLSRRPFSSRATHPHPSAKRRPLAVLFLLGLGLTSSSPRAFALPQADPPAAPLPAAITRASKIFLGNAGDQENADCLRAYNDFYAGVSQLGHGTLVADPAEADLILELHYEIDLGQSIASNDAHKSVRQFRVVLIDPHTHTVLWSLTERTNYAVFQSNRNKNLDETVATLVTDLGSLFAAQPPNNKSKVKHPF